MRLVSYADPHAAAWRAGIVRDGEVVDAQAALGDTAAASVRGLLALGADRLHELAQAARSTPAVGPRERLRLGPPVPDPDKILCIGLNYTAHAEETRLEPSAAPTVFAKFRNSLVGDGDAIVVPPAAREVDFEGELAVVIGRRCRRVEEQDALAHVGGVMPLNDVSARDLQMQTSQWTAGKAIDTFAPCGPDLVLLDEAGNVQDLGIRTYVNGEVVQNARTSQMIFRIPRIIAFLSSMMTLEVGDVIATGTPAGVGFTREPPIFLQSGDRVDVEIDGVGFLSNPVEREGRG